MECVTECPESAILGKVVPMAKLEAELEKIADPAEREHSRKQFGKTTKYWNAYENKGAEPGCFGIFIDPTTCKGCAECVDACGNYGALKMLQKDDTVLKRFQRTWEFYKHLPETPKEFINEKLLSDMMLAERSLLYVGAAGSCMGCGEATALRMMLAATGFIYGKENIGLVNSTGCSTVYASTYPYNPYLVPWTNSLFENAPADAMGIRARWNQMGWQNTKLWVIGGDGAMLDIGFQSLSRMLASGMKIKVLVLDTQVYSNTGGQSSTASFMGQNTKFSVHGTVIPGKIERRKELAQIWMMHPNTFVAQTSCAMPNHFYKSILAANEYDGPAVVSVYTTCQPEHGVGDNMAMEQNKLAVETRTFPVLRYDPRKGLKIAERLGLQGNPATKEDWFVEPKTNEKYDFVKFARSEGRFSKHFQADGTPSTAILASNQERLENWRTLQELAGIL